MTIQTLSEAKSLFGTEKVHETATAWLVNDWGKYRPNLTFVVGKGAEEGALKYREDSAVRKMVQNMNLDISGDVSVLFGDCWKSQKGTLCFRPKGPEHAQHVLVKVAWGGAFDRRRGLVYGPAGAVYFRRAASNGGGAGYDYLVVPVGFGVVIHDPEIDGDQAAKAADPAAVRASIVEADRQADIAADAAAAAKAEAEAVSRAAKEAGLGARLEAVNQTLAQLGQELVRLEVDHFVYGCYRHLYTEANVAAVESTTRGAV